MLHPETPEGNVNIRDKLFCVCFYNYALAATVHFILVTNNLFVERPVCHHLHLNSKQTSGSVLRHNRAK